MARALEILVVESEQGAAASAVDALRDAGHQVHRCSEPGAPAFPCAAIDDRGACPLEGRSVDVAVTVRARPRSQPAPLEGGLTCAIKHHVPIVVAGSTALHPFEDYAGEVVERDADLVGVVERVAAAPLAGHERVARDALGALLELHGVDPGAGAARVVRRGGGLVVSVTVPESVERRTRDMAAVRVTAALRRLDPDAASVDVEVRTA